MAVIKCSCCDSIITKVVLVNGKQYGSYCAKKIIGTKTSIKFAFQFEDVITDPILRGHGNVTFNNKQYDVIFSTNSSMLVSYKVVNNKHTIGCSSKLFNDIIGYVRSNVDSELSIDACLKYFASM